MNAFDIITIGDATIDAFLSIHDASVHCRLDKESCELCVKYGEKIPVDSASFQLGGNACNVAVGGSRLGFKTALVAEIGSDEFSEKIVNGLAREHVDQTLIKRTEGAASTFAIGINFQGERTLFVEHVLRQHKFLFDGVISKWVYLTSLGNEWKGAYEKTVQFVKTANAKLILAPGTLQLDEPEALQEALVQTDILFVNKEEGAKIVNYELRIKNEGNEKDEISRLLEELQRLGPKAVVLTDGLNGSYLLTENKDVLFQEIFPAPIVERTGAGDAYAAGFLGALFNNKSLKEAMVWGTLNAGSVVGKVGAEPGLLTKEEMEAKTHSISNK